MLWSNAIKLLWIETGLKAATRFRTFLPLHQFDGDSATLRSPPVLFPTTTPYIARWDGRMGELMGRAVVVF
jgi:hypothetical protein